MKTKTYLIVSIALLTGVSAWAQANVYVSIYDDCSKNGKKEDFHAVGLVLPSGIKWARCNIGAISPEDYGNYYAWGETAPKENYSWATYKYANGAYDKLTKYCSNNNYGDNGFRDSLTTLKPEDDAAHVNWGGNWRMPTDDEWIELLENCTWTLTVQNGVIGYKVESRSGGGVIFLPAAGYRDGTDLSGADFYGCYWSSSLRTDYPYWAWRFYFYSGYENRNYHYRYIGQPVRAVCP